MEINHVEVSATGYFTTGGGKDMAVDSTGRIYVIYDKGVNPYTDNYIYISYSDDAGLTWTEESSGIYGEGSVITIDQNNDIHILYHVYSYPPYQWNLRYCKRTSGVWETPEELENNNTYNYTSGYDLAVDSTGEVHVVWCISSVLYYRKRTVSAWEETETITTGVSYPRIVIDADDTVYMFYVSGYDFKCGRKTVGGSWAYEQIENFDPKYGYIYGNPAIDSSGNVYLCIYNYVPINTYVCKRLASDGTWSTGTQVFTVPTTESVQAMTINSTGDIYLFWNVDADCYYTRYHNSIWEDAVLFYTSSIVLVGEELLAISFNSFTSVTPKISATSVNIPEDGFRFILNEYAYESLPG